jgi:hypothetical protein
MGREVWGTYSVRDHTVSNAFLADLLFYDRLVLPVPVRGEEAKWEEKQWDPKRQSSYIEKLAAHRRVRTIEWEIGTWEREREKFATEMAARPGIDQEAAHQAGRDAFLFTRTRLLEGIPYDVRGVTTVPTFTDPKQLASTLGLKTTAGGPIAIGPDGRAAAAMTLKFLAPKVDGIVQPSDLERVLERTGRPEHKKARDAFWRWARDFFAEDVVGGQRSLDAAVEEMADLVADLERAAQWKRARTAGKYLILAGTVLVGMLDGGLTYATVGAAGLQVGQLVFEKVVDEKEVKPTPAGALFTSSIKGLPFKR